MSATTSEPGRAAARRPRSRFYDGPAYARLLDPFLAPLHQYVADHVEPTGRILDVGCGTGDLVWRLAEKADEVVGVELSPAMVDYANARRSDGPWPHVSFVLGDVTRALAHLPDGHFDLASLVLTLHEMPVDARTPVLRETARLARQVMCVDFCTPMPWNLAGLRNRIFEAMAGPEHLRAFRAFQRQGGAAGAAAAAGLAFEHTRLIDAGTVEVSVLSRTAPWTS